MAEFNPGGAASLDEAVKLRYEANADTNAFSDAEKAKLAAIASAATANAPDADLRDRATHTGAQSIATVSGLQSALEGKAPAVHVHAIGEVSGLQAVLDGKQAALVSGTTIRSVNGASLLGAGDLVIASGGPGDPVSYITLGSDSAVSTTAFENVAGMAFGVEANRLYEVEILGRFQTAAGTTGIGVAFDIPSGTVTGLAFAPSGNTAVLVTQQTADDTVVEPTTAVAAAGTDYPIFGRYLIATGATGGAVQLRQRSEVAASSTILRAGLLLKWRVAAAAGGSLTDGNKGDITVSEGASTLTINAQAVAPAMLHPETAALFAALDVAQSFTRAQGTAVAALADDPVIATEASLSNQFRVTLGGNRIMGAPANLVEGRVYAWEIRQDAGGSRTLSWHGIFRFPGGSPPVLQTAPGASDLVTARFNGTHLHCIHSGGWTQ